MTLLPVLHFNDVYRVTKQKLQSGGTIDVTQFSQLVNDLRSLWKEDKGGLLLFSGDLFSPSVESSVTRGSHMVPVINQIHPDVALTGNHDFDFGYPHLCKLIQGCKFPWLLSNIIDTRTGSIPEHLEPFRVFERGGVKVGIIGLVEKNWIATVPSWPSEFQYQDMAQVATALSKTLRDPSGEHKCDLVFALTHSRLPNDISLGKAVYARSSLSDVYGIHGVDLILGGHDHTYYIGKGIESWEGYERVVDELGAEEDDGVRVIKSGTDFRDLSEMVLEIVDAPPNSVRRKIIKSITGKRHQITPGMPSSPSMTELLSTLLSDVSESLSAPVCYSLSEWDVRSEVVRTNESAIGNWMADVLRHTYDETIHSGGRNPGGADGVLICGGTLRGDSRYGPGTITIGDILEILPFEDPIIVIEVDGETIWKALESALSMYPSQEGRFPIVSGFRVEWDSTKPPGYRLLGLWRSKELDSEHLEDLGEEPRHVRGEAIPNQKGGTMYKLVTREYMYQGHDGFEALAGKPCLVDEESGLIMSSIIRKFLLGSQYIHKMKQLAAAQSSEHKHRDPSTDHAISHARAKWNAAHSPGVSSLARMRWVEATKQVLRASQEHSRRTIGDALRVGGHEHMSSVDAFDGDGARSGVRCKLPAKSARDDEPGELITVYPVIDGRLKDIARVR